MTTSDHSVAQDNVTDPNGGFPPVVTDDDVAISLGDWLQSVVGQSVEIIQGQPNRVPEPKNDDFVVFTILSDKRLATTVDTYDPVAGTATHMEPLQTSYQLDVHGPNSTNNARTIKLLWRSLYACDTLDKAILQPLYASDGAQRPFINGEGQYENRWVLTLEMQINPTVSTPQQFADNVAVPLLPVGA